jgi:hypothetical protein
MAEVGKIGSVEKEIGVNVYSQSLDEEQQTSTDKEELDVTPNRRNRIPRTNDSHVYSRKKPKVSESVSKRIEKKAVSHDERKAQVSGDRNNRRGSFSNRRNDSDRRRQREERNRGQTQRNNKNEVRSSRPSSTYRDGRIERVCIKTQDRITEKLVSVGYGFVDYLRHQCVDTKSGSSFFRVGTPGIDCIFDPLLNSNGEFRSYRDGMRSPPLEVSNYFILC